MEYMEAKEKEALKNVIYNLETIGDQSHLEEELKQLYQCLESLNGGDGCVLQLSDVLDLVQITSYCEGMLMGAKLFKMLDGQMMPLNVGENDRQLAIRP